MTCILSRQAKKRPCTGVDSRTKPDKAAILHEATRLTIIIIRTILTSPSEENRMYVCLCNGYRDTEIREIAESGVRCAREEIGRAHVCTPVTNAHIVCRLLLEKKNNKQHNNNMIIY